MRRYREHPAPPALEPWVACSWDGGDHRAPLRVLPDGCVDVVVVEGRGVFVAGPQTRSIEVAERPGTRMVGVRLRAGAASALLGAPAVGLRDGRPPLEALWADAGRRLGDALDGADDPRGVLLGALAARAATAPLPDGAVQHAVLRLGAADARVADVAAALGLSERQLRRRFDDAVGLGPKLLARVLRLQRALGAVRAGGDLARAAVTAGYADQAHFANDCRALAGAPPSAFARPGGRARTGA